MNTHLNTEIRELTIDELDGVSGAKGRGSVSVGDTYDIAGKGLLTIGVTTLANGQTVPWAMWEPGEKI